jgi:Spy/CpxP family protein refolding chaperone
MVIRRTGYLLAGLVAWLVAIPVETSAQTGDRSPGQTPGQMRGARGPNAQRQLPPIGRNMNAQQLEQFIATWALNAAQNALKLTDDQFETFVPKFTRLQNIRRRILNQRRALMNQLNGLVNAATPQDEAITEKVRELDALIRRAAEETLKVHLDVESVLTPWQRGRFRLFEEQVERQKIDLLRRVGPVTDPAPAR